MNSMSGLIKGERHATTLVASVLTCNSPCLSPACMGWGCYCCHCLPFIHEHLLRHLHHHHPQCLQATTTCMDTCRLCRRMHAYQCQYRYCHRIHTYPLLLPLHACMPLLPMHACKPLLPVCTCVPLVPLQSMRSFCYR